MHGDYGGTLPLPFVDQVDLTWSQAAARWQQLGVSKAQHTRADEARVLRWIDKDLGNPPIARISARVISELVTRWLRDEVGIRTVNRRLEVIRAVLRSAAAAGFLANLPYIKLLPKGPKRIRWLTPDQARQLITRLPYHHQDVVSFALETGLRKRNILDLSWDRVDFKTGIAWIPPNQFKTRRPHAIPLSAAAIAILKRQRGRHARYVFVFRGSPIKEINTKAWRRAVRSLGLGDDFHWHDLRHTWASWHAQSGTPLQAIQEMGGWASPSMVSIYAHLSVDHLRPYLDTIAKMRSM